MNNWILKDKETPVVEPDLHRWAQWFQNSKEERIVARTSIGESSVSTVFLALDHSFGGCIPILWETMVFGGKLDQEMDRCSGNREQAEAMHLKMIERVKRAEPGK